MSIKKLSMFILIGVIVGCVQAVVIDDFEDGNMDEYTQTIVLDLGDDPGQIVFEASGGAVWAVIETYDGIEQGLCLRDDYSLDVGETLMIDTSGFVDGSQDIGLAVAATTAQTAGLRQDYISLYMRSSTSVYSRGFNGTSDFPLAGGSTGGLVVDALFIERIDTNTFQTGWISGSTVVVIAERTVSNTDIGTAIGFYSDMRDVGSIGGLDNLAIIAEATPPSIVSHPDDVTVNEMQTAIFETVFTSESTPSAAWYRVASPDDVWMDPAESGIDVQLTYDAVSEQYTSTLTMAGVTTSDGGQYYGQITNDTGAPHNSDAAGLTVYGLVAHWTFNQDRYSNSDYLEEVSGYDADVTGTPTFVTGADGTVGGAVQITETDGWAMAPVFDPVQQSGQMTVSFWANWSQAQGMEADLQADSSAGEQLIMANGLKADTQWQHVCTVYDGTTGKLYVDGVLRDEGTWPLPTDTEAAINIGISGDQTNVFNGAMDDLRLYNYAMTEFEVADLRYAFSGQRSCILEYGVVYDLSGASGQPDCVIDLYDLTAFATQWLSQYDMDDFLEVSGYWQSSGLYPDEN